MAKFPTRFCMAKSLCIYVLCFAVCAAFLMPAKAHAVTVFIPSTIHISFQQIHSRLVLTAAEANQTKPTKKTANKAKAKPKSATKDTPVASTDSVKANPIQLTPWKEANELKDRITSGLKEADKPAAIPAAPKVDQANAPLATPDKPQPSTSAVAAALKSTDAKKTLLGPGGRPLTLAEIAELQAKEAAKAAEEKAKADDAAAPPTIPNPADVAPKAASSPPAQILGEILFPLPQGTRFAAFWRAPYFWFVYADPQVSDGPLDGKTKQPTTLGPRRKIAGANYVAYTIKLPPNIAIQEQQVDQQGVHYMVMDQPPLALPPLPWNWERDAPDTGPRLRLGMRNAGRTLIIADPVVGDELTIIPAPAAAASVPTAQETRPEFIVLPGLHGLALHQNDPAMQINVEKQSILLIKPPKGLQQDAEVFAQADAAALFPLAKWAALAGDADPNHFRQQRESELVGLQGLDRLNHIQDTARALFALNRAYEAVGWIGLLSQDFPRALETPEIRLLRGITRAMTRDYSTGDADLDMKGYAYDPEVAMWRMYIASQQQDWARAKFFLQIAGQQLYHAPKPYDVHIMLAGIAAAYNNQDIVTASNLIKTLAEHEDLSDSDKAQISYWQGALAMRTNDYDGARQFFKEAIDAHNPQAAARAQLAQTQMDLADKKIEVDEAIKNLEMLRFSWRGDDIERATLAMLADLYLQSKNYRPAFEIWESLIKYFPQTPEAATAADQLVSQFMSLFGGTTRNDQDNQKAEAPVNKLAPIEALALYRDFQKYQPIGAARQAITQSLAERLQQVGLADEAAKLLTEQINDQTSLENRKSLTLQLARAYLAGNQSDSALQSLTAIENADWTADEKKEVDLMRARAAFIQQDSKKVYDLMDNRSDVDALKLLVNTAWREQNWTRVIAALEKLIGPAPAANAVLSDEKAKLLVRQAIAMTLAKDAAGLEALAQKFGPAIAQTGYAASFRLLTRPPAEGVSPSNLTTIQANLGEVDMFTNVLKQPANSVPNPSKKQP